jgi:nucleotide-binding universal stress UspA family protein
MLPPKIILAPVDFSPHANEALKVAADLAVRFGSELCLVHVVPFIPKLPSPGVIFHEHEYEQALHTDAETRLKQMGDEIARSKGIAVTTRVGTANVVGQEILLTAEHIHADLVVIASHGMAGWHKLAFGSVADKVVRLATCPVLLLPVQPKAEGSETVDSRDSVAVSR